MANGPTSTSLFLFTLRYPYGTGETFIENELRVLSELFATIYIFPLSSVGFSRELPENVKVVHWEDSYRYEGKKALTKHFFHFFKIFIFEFFRSGTKIKMVKKFAELRSSLLQNLTRADCISQYIDKKANVAPVFYSFWFSDWATVLGVLKEKRIIPNYFSRAHGFDLYAERRKDDLMPFRNFQLHTVKKLFAVSKAGVDYLCKEYQNSCSKIKLGFLGVFDHGLNPMKEEGVFTLVSCSNLVPLKRIHLIIEILKNVKINTQWIHFGDGALKEKLMEQSLQLPTNIKIDFRGQVSNKEILEFYKATPVNLFINASTSEGIPVSIMEAVSFGIPVVATNVGGTAEIVNSKTGILIPCNFDCSMVAEIINSHKTHYISSIKFRKGVRDFWADNFDAVENYKLFYSQITID